MVWVQICTHVLLYYLFPNENAWHDPLKQETVVTSVRKWPLSWKPIHHLLSEFVTHPIRYLTSQFSFARFVGSCFY